LLIAWSFIELVVVLAVILLVIFIFETLLS